MGCSWGKQDVWEDRQRLEGVDATEIGSGRAFAIGIARGSSFSQELEGPVYGSSATDAFIKEVDFFRGVIDRTQRTFIDISQELMLMDEQEAEQRRNKYIQAFGNGSLPSTPRILSVPKMVDFQPEISLQDVLVQLAESNRKRLKDVVGYNSTFLFDSMTSIEVDSKRLVAVLDCS